jgi:AmpD protein
VDLIVVHSISLPPGNYGGDGVQRLFTNTLDWNAHPYYRSIEGLQVSAHFYIRRNGELWQFVSCDDRAWHAGVSHYRGRDNCNDDSIGIELEGLEGDLFETAQYETLASLCAAIPQRYPIAHIAGHEHVAPGRKIDPGIGFSWAHLRQTLGWPLQCFPEGVA